MYSQIHAWLDNSWTKITAVKTARKTIGALQGTQKLHALPVLKEQKWQLDREHKRVTALEVFGFLIPFFMNFIELLY